VCVSRLPPPHFCSLSRMFSLIPCRAGVCTLLLDEAVGEGISGSFFVRRPLMLEAREQRASGRAGEPANAKPLAPIRLARRPDGWRQKITLFSDAALSCLTPLPNDAEEEEEGEWRTRPRATGEGIDLPPCSDGSTCFDNFLPLVGPFLPSESTVAR